MSTPKLIRTFIKHRAEPTVYALETDEEGNILAALDVSDAATKGGLCPHMLASMALTGRVEDLEYLTRAREAEFEDFVPECGDVHHLMTDLLSLEKEYQTSCAAFAMADSRAKSLKKDMELKGARVHECLTRVRQPRLPFPPLAAATA